MKIPIGGLPDEIKEEFQELAGFLYTDLSRNKSVTALEDAPHKTHPNHKIRKMIEWCPTWYSEIYAEIQDGQQRKKRTSDTRKRILNALQKICNEEDSPLGVDERRFSYQTICRFLIKKNVNRRI